jgi:hypothetical protein
MEGSDLELHLDDSDNLDDLDGLGTTSKQQESSRSWGLRGSTSPAALAGRISEREWNEDSSRRRQPAAVPGSLGFERKDSVPINIRGMFPELLTTLHVGFCDQITGELAQVRLAKTARLYPVSRVIGLDDPVE